MKNKIKLFIFYPLQFLIFLIIFYFFRILSYRLASTIGGKIFSLFGPLTNSNKITKKNLKKIYPRENKDFLRNVSLKSWENLGRTMAEFAHIEEITNMNNRHIIIKGGDNLKLISQNKEQAIFIAIHQSNWEILASTIGSYGIKLNSVYRHINNPFIDNYILNIRKKIYKSSNSILSPKGKKSAQDMLKSIKAGYSIALLIDQKDSSGIPINLLGYPAKTQIGFLKLSRKFNLKIYPVENNRINKHTFQITIHQPIDVSETEKEISEIEIMTKIHNLISNWINHNPESWLWQHNRWT